MKRPTIIKAADVPRIFDDDCVQQFTKLLDLDASLQKPLAKAIRRLARVSIRTANTPNDDDIAREIKALYAAAERRKYENAAKLVRGISRQTRAFLNKRAKRIDLTIPKPSALLDRRRREAACEMVQRLTTVGGYREQSGWVPNLYLPKRQFEREEIVQDIIRPILEDAEQCGEEIDVAALRRKASRYVLAKMAKDAKARGIELELRSPKRKAEIDFINGLQVAFNNITGIEPPVTARASELTGAPSPFVQVAKKCLVLMGADNADAGGLINKLRTRHPEKQPSRKKGRKPRK
jgi:hypothetical protein